VKVRNYYLTLSLSSLLYILLIFKFLASYSFHIPLAESMQESLLIKYERVDGFNTLSKTKKKGLI